MKYVMSDLHGCYELYMKMLEKIGFSDDDTLYILGDVADRGDGPIDIYFDMMKRPNVVPLLGNHDQRMRALTSQYDFTDIAEIMELAEKDEYMRSWVDDGGIQTLLQYLTLSAEEKKELREYQDAFPPCTVVEAGGNTFFLSHTAPKKDDMQDLSKCDICDFTWGDIEYGKRYFENGYLVTGHTPTALFGEEYRGKILKINGHIDIDCGAVFIGTLGCLCLDTMEEFYVEGEGEGEGEGKDY